MFTTTPEDNVEQDDNSDNDWRSMNNYNMRENYDTELGTSVECRGDD